MAENKREDWELERDREEIATLLCRNRRMSRQRIADQLNRRRLDEYRRLVNETLAMLKDGDLIPDVREPYTLTRQQIDYDIRALEKQFRNRAAEKYEQAKGYHLAELEELHRTAWADYERSKRPTEKKSTNSKAITLRTTEIFDAGDLDLTRRIAVPATQTTDKIETETMHGDPRLLGIVRDALIQKAEIQNLTPTKELDLNLRSTDIKLVAGFNPSDWDKKETNDTASTPPAATDTGTDKN